MLSYNQEKLIIIEKMLKEILVNNQISFAESSKPSDVISALQSAELEISRIRGRRKAFQDSDIFFDPAWDILLELFVANAREAKLSVSAVGLGSGLAQATVIRWISLLASHGLVKRVDDAMDRRRSWIYLTNKSNKIMSNYLLSG